VSRRSFATILVGSSALQREALARFLHAAGFQIVASGATLPNLQLDAKQQAILLIVDSSNDPGVMVGIVGQFKARYPAFRVVVLGENESPTNLDSLFRAGANIYFAKVFTCDAFIKALKMVMIDEPAEVVCYGQP
jgi:two-component system nitrate/nitrite response regulator NarL